MSSNTTTQFSGQPSSFSVSGLKGNTEYTARPTLSIMGYQMDATPTAKFKTEADLCPDDHHPHMIDLGLPSGTMWACCNVGASKPDGYGNYYAWGETSPKSVYNWDTYQHGSVWDIVNIGSDIAGTSYDAATANWGAPWCMPSKEQFQELVNNCTSVWITENGVNGRKLTGPNGGTIFLPAAGSRSADELDGTGSLGLWWSSTLHESNQNIAWHLYFHSGGLFTYEYFNFRYLGLSVRPVRSSGATSPSINVITLAATDVSGTSATLNGSIAASNTNKSYEAGFFLSTTSSSPSSTDFTKKVTCSSSSPVGDFSASATGLVAGTKYYYRAYVLYDGKYYYGDTNSFTTSSSTSYTSCPDNNHPHMIDLGLPSGTKWACCNVGTSKPEGYGNFYAWGETQPKDNYDWTTYIHCDGSEDTCHNIGSDIAGTSYDAATINWGMPWCIPSLEQCHELIEKCQSVWTTENGVNGCKFTGPNGGFIFLPAAGSQWGGKLLFPDSHGYYWSSTLDSRPECALYLNFDTKRVYSCSNDFRGLGQSVRPVCK